MRQRSVRLFAVGCVALLVAALTAGCGTSGSSSAKQKNGMTKIRVSATDVDSLPFMAVLKMAIDKGWFKAKKLDVSIYSGSGGGNTLRVVTTGDADIAIASGASVVTAASKPAADLTVIAPWFQVNDFFWIGKGSSNSIQGSKLGFSSAGSSTELQLKAIKAKQPQDKFTSVPVGTMGDNWSASKASKITAGWAMHPFITEKQRTDGAHTLFRARDILGDSPADMVAVNSGFAKDNSDAVTAFLAVCDQAMSYVADQPAAAAPALAKLVGVSSAVMSDALKNTPNYKQGYSMKVNAKALENLSSMMESAGVISKPIDWSKTLEQKYLPAADRASFNG